MNRRAPLARLAEDRGFSLIELMVVLSVMGLIMTAFLGLLASVQRSLVRETNRSTTMDQARLAMEGIDRQVRSGSVVCVNTTGYTLRLYTRSAYSTSNSTAMRWIQYRVQSNRLERQQSTNAGTSTNPLLYSSATWPSTWRTLATGIVNSTPNVPFSLDTSSQYTSALGASRLVNVTLVVNSNESDTSSTSTKLTSAIAIRNQDSSLVLSCP